MIGGMIPFTAQGLEFQRSSKSYEDYIEEKNKKADLDDRHIDLQIQDLEIKLMVMNEAQLGFYKSQNQRYVQTKIAIIFVFNGCYVEILQILLISLHYREATMWSILSC